MSDEYEILKPINDNYSLAVEAKKGKTVFIKGKHEAETTLKATTKNEGETCIIAEQEEITEKKFVKNPYDMDD